MLQNAVQMKERKIAHENGQTAGAKLVSYRYRDCYTFFIFYFSRGICRDEASRFDRDPLEFRHPRDRRCRLSSLALHIEEAEVDTLVLDLLGPIGRLAAELESVWFRSVDVTAPSNLRRRGA
ncbi:hypothetical protein PI124_g7254 [Phytophthora idaei]|nr:hypothetical protein PI125_g14262 [Phytophthora idaei]KAG3146353.1 hypothetical protein PI126_g13358 [Phytophthora idaei]KAG3248054.1 hypothetical protein PI124_g7254 [Phytophthora idaei]